MSDDRVLTFDMETTGLDPTVDRVLCIGVHDSKEDEVQVFWGCGEEDTVRSFVKWVRGKGFDKVVGFNVTFDTRMVMAKCADYRIPIGWFLNKSGSPRHVDLMDVVQNPVSMYSPNDSKGLDDWSRFLFGDVKEEDNGDIARLYGLGEYERIESYCRADVWRTVKLGRRLRSVGVL